MGPTGPISHLDIALLFCPKRKAPVYAALKGFLFCTRMDFDLCIIVRRSIGDVTTNYPATGRRSIVFPKVCLRRNRNCSDAHAHDSLSFDGVLDVRERNGLGDLCTSRCVNMIGSEQDESSAVFN